MSDYFLAPSLVTLREQVDREFPRRDKGSDGWIGDPSHAAAVSSHNPDWHVPGRRRGVVRGLDVDVDDRNPNRDLRRELLTATIGDPRVWYVISNGIIYSLTHGWSARRYTGANPHFSHVHISIRPTEFAEFNTRKWLGDVRVTLPKVDLSNVRKEFRDATDNKASTRVQRRKGVARIQRALNAKNGSDLKVDGVVGPNLIREWRQWERRIGVDGRPAMPDKDTLRRLGRGRFRVVE